MRTFPRELAAFRKMIEERGARLRQLPFARLSELAAQPVEHVKVDRRKGTIGIIVLPSPNGGLRIVLQGFLEHHLMPGKSVALDGFFKYPDETTAPMEAAEFSRFD